MHLLPGFDEYVIGYADRVPPLGRFAERYSASIGTNGLLRPTLVTDDRVAGTWTSNTRKAGVDLELSPFRRLTRPQRAATVVAAERYAAFLRKRVNVRG